MTYNEQETIQKVEQILTDFEFAATASESKQNILNQLNGILYPIKEQGLIEDFQFSVKNNEDNEEIDISVLIKETSESDFGGWDFTITNGSK